MWRVFVLEAFWAALVLFVGIDIVICQGVRCVSGAMRPLTQVCRCNAERCKLKAS